MDLERTGVGSDDIIRHKSRRWKNLKATRRSSGLCTSEANTFASEVQRHFWKALLSYLKSKSQYTVLLYVRLDKQLVSHHSWHGCAMWSDVWRDASEHQKAVAKPPLRDWDNMTVNQKYMQVTQSSPDSMISVHQPHQNTTTIWKSAPLATCAFDWHLQWISSCPDGQTSPQSFRHTAGDLKFQPLCVMGFSGATVTILDAIFYSQQNTQFFFHHMLLIKSYDGTGKQPAICSNLPSPY